MLSGLEELERRGMADCFKLLHFHLGSQITNIRQVKAAVNEAVRIYVDLQEVAAPAWNTSTSAADSASTTTGHRPTSSRASTTRCRSTRTTSSITFRRSATKRALSIRRSFQKADAPWRPTIACSSSARSASPRPADGSAHSGEEVPEDYEQPLHDLQMTYSARFQRPQPARELTTTRSRRSTWR